MRVDAGTAQRYVPRPASPAGGSSFAAALRRAAEGGGASTAALDFTSMTRQELFDLINGEITGGRMSLDESTPLIGLTMRMRLDGTDVPLATDTDRVDFTQRVRDGIEGARWFQDEEGARRLEWALAWMQGRQGTPTGVDATA